MYKESWGEKRICPMCSKQYYDLGRSELECPECGKQIEVTTMSRPRRGRKPGSTNAAPLVNPIPPKAFGGIGFTRGAAFVLPGFLPRLGLDIVVTSICLPHSGHSNSDLPRS